MAAGLWRRGTSARARVPRPRVPPIDSDASYFRGIEIRAAGEEPHCYQSVSRSRLGPIRTLMKDASVVEPRSSPRPGGRKGGGVSPPGGAPHGADSFIGRYRLIRGAPSFLGVSEAPL